MSYSNLIRRVATLSAVAVAITLTRGLVLAQDRAPTATPSGPECTVAADIARFDLPLGRLAMRLAAGLPIKIIAIGSSSTYGAGASASDRSYPSRLEAELRRHFLGHPITVLNRGVNGEETSDMVARFATGVIAENPHLVIWQIGTNSLLRDRALHPQALVVHEGIDRLKAIGTDIVLMDLQYAPRVLAKPGRDAVVGQIAQIAKEEKIGHLRRFDIMRHWYEVEHLPFETFVTGDGLHMNDWGYACLARSLGAAIAGAATRSTETAAVPPARR